jgi:hypothetical protein
MVPMDRGSIGSRPPVGTWEPGEVPCVLIEYMRRGNSTRPVGVGEALDICAVFTVALSFRVRASTPVIEMKGSWGDHSGASLEWGSWEGSLSLLPKMVRDKGEEGIPCESIGGDQGCMP